MNIGELKEKIEAMPKGAMLEKGISEPFSWRGSYDEVAFSITSACTREEALQHINTALSESFYGYKGGEYRYGENTPVNFENSGGSYSDGEYREDMIDTLEDRPVEYDRDAYLASLITGN